MPAREGRFSKSSVIASCPPAEAPIATTGKEWFIISFFGVEIRECRIKGEYEYRNLCPYLTGW